MSSRRTGDRRRLDERRMTGAVKEQKCRIMMMMITMIMMSCCFRANVKKSRNIKTEAVTYMIEMTDQCIRARVCPVKTNTMVGRKQELSLHNKQNGTVSPESTENQEVIMLFTKPTLNALFYFTALCL